MDLYVSHGSHVTRRSGNMDDGPLVHVTLLAGKH